MLQINGTDWKPFMDSTCKVYEKTIRSLLENLRQEAVRLPNPFTLSRYFLRNLNCYYQTYEQYARYFLAQTNFPVSCRSGCANCCYHMVCSVEPFETINIYRFLRRQGRWKGLPPALTAFNSRFAQARKKVQRDYPDFPEDDKHDEALEQFFRQGNPCPFLDGGQRCSIYQVRPFPCRMYLSSSPSSMCAPASYFKKEARIFTVLLDKEQDDVIQGLSTLFPGPRWKNEMTRDLLRLDRWLVDNQPTAAKLFREVG